MAQNVGRDLPESQIPATIMGVYGWVRAGGLLSNDFADKWVQLIIVFDPHKVVNNISSTHGDDCRNSRHLEIEQVTLTFNKVQILWPFNQWSHHRNLLKLYNPLRCCKNILSSSHPIFNGQVCVIIDVNFCHGDAALLFCNSFFQPRPKDLTGTAPSKRNAAQPGSVCSLLKDNSTVTRH